MALKRIRLDVPVDSASLAHLLWDALLAERGPVRKPEATAKFVFYLPDRNVKVLINRQLVQCGLASVKNGPRTPYPSAEVQEKLAERVAAVYGP